SVPSSRGERCSCYWPGELAEEPAAPPRYSARPGAGVDLGRDEKVEQLTVERAHAPLAVEDVERLLGRYGLLVWAVGRGERVVDIGDRHDLRLQRNVGGLHAERIARPVELFVMRPRNLGHAAELLAPRDALEEFPGVDDVRAHLVHLDVGEAAPRDGEDARLLRGDDRLMVAEMVLEGPERQIAQALHHVARQDARLVGHHDAI